MSDFVSTGIVLPGQCYALDTTCTFPDGIDAPVRWSVEGNTSNRTFVTHTGVLHVGFDEKSGNTIRVSVKAVVTDPSNLRAGDKASSALTLTVGEGAQIWPRNSTSGTVVVAGVIVSGVSATAIDASTWNVTVPDDTTVKAGDIEVDTAIPADVKVSISGSKTAGYVLTLMVDSSSEREPDKIYVLVQVGSGAMPTAPHELTA